jgi:hypothetical protein
VGSANWGDEERIELNHLVQRLLNVVYLLELEPNQTPRIRLCLEIAERDLERLQALIGERQGDEKDRAA